MAVSFCLRGGLGLDGTATSDNSPLRGDNHVTTMTAVVPGEMNQSTGYIYGVNTSQGSLINDNDLLYQVQYPDPGTGSNYATVGTYNQSEGYTYDALGE